MRRFGFIFLLFIVLASAQTPEWVYQYENPERSEWPTTVVVDGIGNSYTTGLISNADTSGIGIIKLDSAGLIDWFYFNDTFGGGAGYDMVYAFGDLYLAGVTGDGRMIVICVDTLGQELWCWFDTVFSSEGNAIAISPGHNVYVAGIKYPSPSDWVVIKLDSLGQECWRYEYDGPGGSYDEANSIVIDGEENVYVGGYSTGVGTGTDFTVIKLDSSGTEQWVYWYDGPGNYKDEITDIAMDSVGYVYALGWSWSQSDIDFCLVKIDSSGQQRWVYRYNGLGDGDDYAYRFVVDDTGNVYVCGKSWGDSVSLFTVIKVDSLGQEEWCYHSVGPWDKGGGANCLTLDGSGAIYIAGGFTNLSGRGQIALVKLNYAGDSLWTYVYPHQPGSSWGSDVSRDIVADISGNIYLAGKICVSNWDDDIVVMKFSGSQGVSGEVRKGDLSDYLYSTIFQGGLSFLPSEDGEIRVYDVSGKVVIRDYFKQNRKVFYPLSAGVYFVWLYTDKETRVEKVVLINR